MVLGGIDALAVGLAAEAILICFVRAGAAYCRLGCLHTWIQRLLCDHELVRGGEKHGDMFIRLQMQSKRKGGVDWP